MSFEMRYLTQTIFYPMINYGVIRTRFINFDYPGPLFDTDMNLMGINVQFRSDHNLATRADVVRNCFTNTNQFNLSAPLCLRDYKYFNYDRFGVKFPNPAAFDEAMQDYVPPPAMTISAPSSKWPEHPIDFDYYVDVLGEKF